MMSRKKSVKIFLCLAIIVNVVIACLVYYFYPQKTVIHLGVYSESSWDVPNNSSELIDTVIKTFQKKHPNVEIKYESGLLKEDYSNWLSDKIITCQAPDIFKVPENDFTLLASTGALKSLNISESVSRNFYSSAYESGIYQQKV